MSAGDLFHGSGRGQVFKGWGDTCLWASQSCLRVVGQVLRCQEKVFGIEAGDTCFRLMVQVLRTGVYGCGHVL